VPPRRRKRKNDLKNTDRKEKMMNIKRILSFKAQCLILMITLLSVKVALGAFTVTQYNFEDGVSPGSGVESFIDNNWGITGVPITKTYETVNFSRAIERVFPESTFFPGMKNYEFRKNFAIKVHGYIQVSEAESRTFRCMAGDDQFLKIRNSAVRLVQRMQILYNRQAGISCANQVSCGGLVLRMVRTNGD